MDAFLGDQRVLKAYLGADLVIGSEDPPAPSLDLAPAEDQPTISTGELSQWGPPSIVSDGWWRERRTGYGETEPGGTQSSTTDLDVGGSSYFRYPGVPGAVGHPANAGGYVLTPYKPGGSPQNARWLFNVSFTTASPTVELRFRSSTANPDLGLVLVNGKRIQERTVPQSLGASGVGYSAVLTFPDARERTITIYGLNHVGGEFGGVAVEPGYTVARPQPIGKTVAIIGDSYVNGHSTVAASETFAFRLGLLMGGGTIIQAGIGGTGFTKTLSGQPNSSFAGRLSDVLNLNPDVLIFAGGRNDSTTDLRAAVSELLSSAATVPELYVMPTASEATQGAVRAAIQSACTDRQVPYLDVNIDALAKIADGIHPTWAAHQALADDAWANIQDPPAPPDLSDLPVYDEFSDVADGGVPTVAASGQTWGIFSGPSSVHGGYWDSDDNTAAYLECDSLLQPVTRLGARWRYNDNGGTLTGGSGTMTLISWADGGIVQHGYMPRTSAHVVVVAGFVQWYVNDTAGPSEPVIPIGTQAINPPLAPNVDHVVNAYIGDGEGTVNVDGIDYHFTDPRIVRHDGERFTCYEPYYGGAGKTRVEIAEVWADGIPYEPPPGPEIGLTGAGYTKSEAETISDTVTIPATVHVGDLLVLVGQFISGAAHPLVGPSGWTQVGLHTRAAMSAGVWTKVATSGDIGQPVTVTSQAAKVHNLAVYGIAGVGSAALGAVSDQDQGSANFAMPSYTPTAGAIPAHVLCVVSSANPDPVAYTAPSGMVVASDNMPVSNDRQGILLGVSEDWTPDATVGTTWVADDTTHFGIKWAIELIPS